MSATATEAETKPAFHAEPEPALAPALARWQRVALVVGVLGLALSGVGAFLDPRQAAFSYLFGIVFWTGLSLGMLCILMMHALTNGGWGFVIRRFLEAGSYILPLMALLFVPIFAGLGYLYPWTDPNVVAHNEAIRNKHLYLNIPALAVRMVVAFGFWSVAAWLLNRWSFAQDRTPDVSYTRRARALAAPGLVAFALITSMAIIDWIMVLEKDWYSTVFAPQVIIGQILVAFAFCSVLLSFVRPYLPWRGVVKTEHFHSLGNFLLAFTMMWAYLAVSQLIIIWSGNLPHEIEWYLHRVAGGWKPVAIFLGLFHFAVPFFVLLGRENKENIRVLRGVAVGIIFVHAVEVFWQIEPSHSQGGLSISWMHFTAFLGIGGVWLAAFLGRLKNHARLPSNDPRFEEAITDGH